MRDVELRARDREARALGTPVERSRVLADRVRMGTLAPERLEIAAYCGNKAAILAGGLTGWANPADPTQRPFGEWIEGLARWGPTVQVRGALALQRAMFKLTTSGPCAASCGVEDAMRARKERLQLALDAQAAWIENPTERARERARWAWSAAWIHREPWLLPPPDQHGRWLEPCGILACVEACTRRSDYASPRGVGPRAARNAITSALVSWSLGGEP